MKKILEFIIMKLGKNIHLFFEKQEDHIRAMNYINSISPGTVELINDPIMMNLKIVDDDKWSDNISQLIDTSKVKDPSEGPYRIKIK